MTDPETMADQLARLQQQIRAISDRNVRVERNKAWETSWTRLLAVTAVTYVTMILVFVVLGSARALVDALVPTLGFLLSSLSLPLVRRIWERNTAGRGSDTDI